MYDTNQFLYLIIVQIHQYLPAVQSYHGSSSGLPCHFFVRLFLTQNSSAASRYHVLLTPILLLLLLLHEAITINMITAATTVATTETPTDSTPERITSTIAHAKHPNEGVHMRRPRPNNPRPRPQPEPSPPTPPSAGTTNETLNSQRGSFCLAAVRSKLRRLFCIPSHHAQHQDSPEQHSEEANAASSV